MQKFKNIFNFNNLFNKLIGMNKLMFNTKPISQLINRFKGKMPNLFLI
jgi:hypothetical protein